MKNVILAAALLMILAACVGQKDVKPAEPEKDVSAVMSENLGKFFAEKQMQGVTFKIDVLEPVEGIRDLKFVKLTFRQDNKTQEQYVFTDGNYIIPDLTDIKTGAGVRDKLAFKHETVTDIDLSTLTLVSGSKDSKNYIVEVSDFQCPYCRRAHEYLKGKLADQDVAVYFMHFPLSFHPKADIYARVFEAGMALGSNFYEELFSTTKEFDQKSDDEIIEYFAAKTSDVAKFKELVANEDIKNKIQSHMQKAQSLGVTGTPALYFNGKFVGGYKPPMYDMAIELFNK